MKLLQKPLLFINRYIGLLTLSLIGVASKIRAEFTPDLPRDFNIAVPTTQIDDIGDFYNVVCAATAWILVFGIIIGAVFVIYGGVRYITSGGDDSNTKDAKGTIRTAVIGIVFLVLAIAIVRIVAGFFGGDLDSFDLISC